MNVGQHRDNVRPTPKLRAAPDTSLYRPFGYLAPPRGRSEVAIPWVLAVLPAISFGFVAFVPFIRLASRRRALRWRLLAAAFVVACAGEWALLIPRETDVVDNVGAITMMTLMVAGTTVAFVLRERLRTDRLDTAPADDPGVMTTAPEQQSPDVGPPVFAADKNNRTCAELTARLAALQTDINSDADFPHDARRFLGDIAASVAQVASHGAAGGRIDGALVELEPIVNDYLPGCVGAYRRLPSDAVHLPELYGGRSASDEVTVQLGLLRDQAMHAATRLHQEDLRRLEEHGAFLREKFGQSELDLP